MGDEENNKIHVSPFSFLSSAFEGLLVLLQLIIDFQAVNNFRNGLLVYSSSSFR
jgi:hypothetical protein